MSEGVLVPTFDKNVEGNIHLTEESFINRHLISEIRAVDSSRFFHYLATFMVAELSFVIFVLAIPIAGIVLKVALLALCQCIVDDRIPL
jgi:hypothetical protein